MQRPLPTTIDQITPEWLTATLREGNHLDAAASVTAVQGASISTGVGFIGEVARLNVTYAAGGGAPASLIVKIPAADHGSRMVGVAFGMYEREVHFYNDLALRLGMPVPKSYGAEYDGTVGQSIILLEDLADGAFGDQVAGATPAQAEQAVDAIGRMHARWWGHADLTAIPWMSSGVENIRGPIQMLFEASWRPMLERFGHLLTPELTAAMPAMGRRTMTAMDTLGGLPVTLIHGDYRPDNIYFGSAHDGRAMVVCDWQGASRGPGIADLAYFIAGSMETPYRRAHEDDLLRRYHDLLLAGGVRGYSLEQLREDYRGYFALVLAGAAVLAGNLPDGNERGRLLIEKTLQRFVAAMTDHDSLALLPA